MFKRRKRIVILFGCVVVALSLFGLGNAVQQITKQEAIEHHTESQLSSIIAEYLSADAVSVVISDNYVTVEISMGRKLTEIEKTTIEHQIQSTLDTEHQVIFHETTH